MNDFLLQIKKADHVNLNADEVSKQHLLLRQVSLMDRGAISYIYKNENLGRSILVIGNAIPRKKAKYNIERWLNGNALLSESEALEWCKSYNGVFILIFINTLENCIHLVTDFLGFYPLYMHEDKEFISLSNSMKWLAEVRLPKPQLDPRAIYSYLHNGHLMFDQSWFTEIKRCEPASIYSYDNTERTLEAIKYWAWDRIAPKRSSSQKAMETYAHHFSQSTLDLDIPDGSSIGIGLSGGLDSRWISQVLSREKSCTAYCFSMNHKWELSLSRKVAAALHIPHVFHELDSSHWLKNRLESFWQGDGCLHLGHLHEGNIHRDLFQHSDIFYHGFYGGGIYGVSTELNRRIHSEIASKYFKVTDGKFKVDNPFFNIKNIDPYIVHHRMRYQAAYSISLLSAFTKIAVPFYDLDWIMYNYSLDDRDQVYGRFYLQVLNRELSSDLLEIPWQRTGLSPKYIKTNCFYQKFKINPAIERVYNLVGKSRHFINYSIFDNEIEFWLKEFSVDIKNMQQNFHLKNREHKLRMLSLVVWIRMLQKNSPHVL